MKNKPNRRKVKAELLGSKVTTLSTNSFDGVLRIEVNGRWFAEVIDPNVVFGIGYTNKVKL